MSRKRQIPSDILRRGRAREKAREQQRRHRLRLAGTPECDFPCCPWPAGEPHEHSVDELIY